MIFPVFGISPLNIDKLKVLFFFHDFSSSSGVKNLPVMQKTQETQVQFLSWEDPLEKEMTTHYSVLNLENFMDSCLENSMDRG